MDNNQRVVLIMGIPSSGKTASLRKMAEDPGIAYLNTDLKDLPFYVPPDGMQCAKIDRAKDIPAIIQQIEQEAEGVHSVILDTVTFLMDQFEMQHVANATDTRAAWGDYGKFYKSFMHQIKSSSKNWIILSHSYDIYNEKELAMETKVPIKGSVGKIGIEADYNIIVTAKKMPIKKLQPYLDNNELLTLSDRDEAMGLKYVFQTSITKDTLNEKNRSPMDLWSESELYIDNDISLIIQRLNDYYSR